MTDVVDTKPDAEIDSDYDLYAASFRREAGELCHWILWVRLDEMNGVTIEADGWNGNWVTRAIGHHAPYQSAAILEFEIIGSIPVADWPAFRDNIPIKFPPDNRSEAWNCQSFIKTVVRDMDKRGWIDDGLRAELENGSLLHKISPELV
ncbi:hypothetical protein PHLCEN_2v4439 [Hermanssonia centrifuga]|uniref:Uncharacterized protein n=1 Tax=Hermanssonia centrifuga TaxID=98765 RepID=A0A2R6PNL6_9APHY|nr:hypothetical protein PHLCEN_2v4439 [Hermanssonia centrifuga]